MWFSVGLAVLLLSKGHFFMAGPRTRNEPEFLCSNVSDDEEYILELAEKLIISRRAQGLRLCGTLRLSITLRYLAGGSYLDLALTHHQSVSAVYVHIEMNPHAIDRLCTIHLPCKNIEWLAEVLEVMTVCQSGKVVRLMSVCAYLHSILCTLRLFQDFYSLFGSWNLQEEFERQIRELMNKERTMQVAQRWVSICKIGKHFRIYLTTSREALIRNGILETNFVPF